MIEHLPLSDASEQLEQRLAVLLPAIYHDTYRDLTPTPMRSAGLLRDEQGQVAWDRMWGSFCDLAMAGGPPHKGAWLAPGEPAEVAAAEAATDAVAAEIGRGVRLVTGLATEALTSPGWLPVECDDATMAEWLTRAIVMENVAARRVETRVEVPVSPAFRIEREIRNVITVLAKTCHYWNDHMSYPQQFAVARLLRAMEPRWPTIVPPDTSATDGAALRDGARRLAAGAARAANLPATPASTAGWVRVACPSVTLAVWLMRALVACNVLARREDTALLVPANPVVDPGGGRVAERLAHVRGLALYNRVG